MAFEKHPNRALSILIAEDDPANQLVALRMLKTLGYNADTVDNGLEALIAMESRSYNLVLMDIQMPRLNGLEATRRIRSGQVEGVPPTMPVVALTAYALEGDRKRFLDAGMDEFVTKPCDMDHLLRAVAKVVTVRPSV